MSAEKPDLVAYWPKPELKPPSPWSLPLTMSAVGKIVATETLDRDFQVFRYQNWSGQIQIPLHTPGWLANTFPGILDASHADALSLDLSRFHLGGLSATDEWEDQCISERVCVDLPLRFPITPPFVAFNGFVDTQKFPLADNPSVGLDGVTRNSSAVFRIWSKFTVTEAAHTPKTGWYANHVYAMLPKCKPHMKKKCEDYHADTTPFRKHGKKAYVTGYLHGFCNKAVVFSESCPYNPLEFVPLIEILKIDWAAGEPRQNPGARDLLATPSKPETPNRGKGRFVFDPLAQMTADAKGPATPSKSISDTLVDDDDPFSVNGLHEVPPTGSKRSGEIEVLDDSDDGASPTKRPKRGSLRGRK
ncbi:hypothetical protein CABS01_16521 [Colletotrichum abscissum]|uniref:uncharacterized protein n=1 Tax=Colletotrichum abscissum TaxID=1671311 RepID=UPI0027D6D1D1|nr:uncharacterized protein CABS01_16521 [Colletotrichum abscissum]KAK1521591.1 hypothetical protein CABS01_16521 [Colletotrichum abscissum]